MTDTPARNCEMGFSQADSLNERMRRVRSDVLYDQLGQGLVATIINALILATIQSPLVGASQAWLWFSAMLVVSLARGTLLLLRRRFDKDPKHTVYWERLFFAGVIATAILWGAASIFLYPVDSVVHQAFTGFVLAGMTAGAVGSFAASHRVFLAFMLPACLPYAVVHLMQGSGIQMAMGLMTLAFIVTTWVTSKKTNAITTEALRLRFENLDLVERLRTVNAELHEEVAEREQAEAKLTGLVDEVTAATNAKSHFLANMSHEIRTPMNGVIGMTDILSRSQLNQRQRHQVSLIQNSAQTLLALLNDILDFSRIEAGRIDLEHAPFELREVVGDAVDVLSDQAETKGLELAYEVAPQIESRMVGDQMRLRQVLINLIGNAVKFTEAGAVILRVGDGGVSAEGRRIIRFCVSDTGIGIDPVVRLSLFDPFKQADPSVTRRFGGSGLGLSISHHLVGLMGGELECASVPGEGSEFYFSMPFEIVAQPDLAISEHQSIFQGRRVLAADENSVTLDIIGNYLKSWDLDVVLEQTGKNVLDTAVAYARRGEPFDAVVVSASLSDMSGLELAARIRGHVDCRADLRADLRGLRIVLLTPVKWSGDMQLAKTRNIVRTVNKPVRQSQLFESLKAAMAPSTDGLSGERELVSSDSCERPNEIAGGLSAHVLLVEDNPVNQEVAAHYLRGFGCTLDIADNGLTALAAIERTSYDVILMDCQMPKMDGFTATKELRLREIEAGLERTPVVALTASAFAGDREQCLAAGMDDHVSKPFVPADLRVVLGKWLVQPEDHTGTPLALGEPGLPDAGIVVEEVNGDTATPDPLDRQQLRALNARSPQLFGRLISLYLVHALPLLENIRRAEMDGDLVALKAEAHALKSSSSNVAATHLAELCQLLEVHGQRGDVAGARVTFADLAAEFGRVIVALEKEAAGVKRMELSE